MANKALYDKNGNPKDKPKKKTSKKVNIGKVFKDTLPELLIGGIGGGVSVGIGLAIVDRVPFLAEMTVEPGLQSTLVKVGVSEAVAVGGLFLASKTIATPKRVAEVAPFVLVGTALIGSAEDIAVNVVTKTHDFFSGLFAGDAAPAGYARRVRGVDVGGDLPPGGRRGRRVLIADNVYPPAGYPGERDGVAFGGDLPVGGDYGYDY